MIKVQQSVVIHRPVEEVFKFVSNPENGHNWQSNLLELHKTGEREVTEVRKVFGRRVERTYEISEQEQARKIAFKGKGRHASGDFTHNHSYAFESVDGSTLFTLNVEADIPWIRGAGVPLVVRAIQRDVQSSLEHLRDLLEAPEELRKDLAKQLPEHR